MMAFPGPIRFQERWHLRPREWLLDAELSSDLSCCLLEFLEPRWALWLSETLVHLFKRLKYSDAKVARNHLIPKYLIRAKLRWNIGKGRRFHLRRVLICILNSMGSYLRIPLKWDEILPFLWRWRESFCHGDRQWSGWEILKRLKLYELDYNNPDEPVVNAQLCILHFFVARSVFPVTDEETPIAAKPVGYEEHVHWRETIVTAVLMFISMETGSSCSILFLFHPRTGNLAFRGVV